jgi:hypothetical protein
MPLEMILLIKQYDFPQLFEKIFLLSKQIVVET